jgi:hypothetical protein
MNKSIVSLLLSGFLALSAGAALAAEPQRINGDVVSHEGSLLRVRTTGGQEVAVKVGDNARITTRATTDLAQLAKGDFLGTTAVPQPDGTLKASEVHVFAESMRGTGEGHRPMDNIPGSTMTNATVTAIGSAKGPANTMTNATVSSISTQDRARRMTLAYKGGEKVVVVPEGTPVTRVEPGDPSLLVKGAHVALTAAVQPDGSLAAERINVGKNGYVPTM